MQQSMRDAEYGARGEVVTAKGFVVPREGGCVLRVDVSTGAKKTAIVGINEWRGTVQVKLAAQPVKGEANSELVRYLSEKLSIPESSIVIIGGKTSTHKQVHLPLDATAVARHIMKAV